MAPHRSALLVAVHAAAFRVSWAVHSALELPADARSLDVATNLAKETLDLRWELRFDAQQGAKVTVVVDGPEALTVIGLSAPDPSSDRPGLAILKLDYECDKGIFHMIGTPTPKNAASAATSIADGWRGRFVPAVVSVLAGALALGRLRAAFLLGLILALAASLGLHVWASSVCEGATTLTLVVASEQWAALGGCGMCPEEYQRKGRFFEWRAPCDVQAAVGAVESAAKNCIESASDECAGLPLNSESVCGLNGWCTGLTEPPAACSLPVEFVQTCMHSHFSSVLIPTTAAGYTFLNRLLRCADKGRPVEGRPYTSSGAISVVAPVRWTVGRNRSSWAASVDARTATALTAMDVPRDWSAEIAAQAADEWLRHGQEEHASVASFSRFSLDLLRFAAPPELLDAAHTAAADEVRHATQAFGLAARFRGEPLAGVAVDGFPVAVVELAPSLDTLAVQAMEEGCFGESAAVARLAYALAHVVPASPSRDIVARLLEDEARHAALAWATVRWAAGSGAGVRWSRGRRHGAGMGGRQERQVSDLATMPPPPLLAWGGRVPARIAAEITDLVNDVWVAPWAAALVSSSGGGGGGAFAALFPGVVLGPAAGTPWGDAVVEAARRVRQHLWPLLVTGEATALVPILPASAPAAAQVIAAVAAV